MNASEMRVHVHVEGCDLWSFMKLLTNMLVFLYRTSVSSSFQVDLLKTPRDI